MNNKPPSTSKRLSWPMALVLIFVIMAAAGVFALWWTTYSASAGYNRLSSSAAKVADALAEITQVRPQVTIKNQVITQQSIAALELAVVTHAIAVERQMTHRYLGSTKELKLHGDFTIKAGFDLEQPFTVDIDDDHIAILLPPAKILSVEQNDLVVEEIHNGYWNKIQPEDLENEIAALATIAREKAHAMEITEEAVSTLREKLRQRLGNEVDFTIQTRARPKD